MHYVDCSRSLFLLTAASAICSIGKKLQSLTVHYTMSFISRSRSWSPRMSLTFNSNRNAKNQIKNVVQGERKKIKFTLNLKRIIHPKCIKINCIWTCLSCTECLNNTETHRHVAVANIKTVSMQFAYNENMLCYHDRVCINTDGAWRAFIRRWLYYSMMHTRMYRGVWLNI